jgi:hypothetical protein
MMEQVAQADEGASSPKTPRNRRPWVWGGVVLAAAVALWGYSKVFAPTLVGTWSNRASENQVTFTFNDDGSGSMTIGAAQLRYRYHFDRTHDPVWLDLDATSEGKYVTIRAIAEFARGDKLKIRLPHTGSPGVRPTEFVDNDIENTILLTRVEPAS